MQAASASNVWCDMIVPHVSSIPVTSEIRSCTPRPRDGMVMLPGMRLENNWVTARLHKFFPAGRRGQQPPGDGGISKSLRIGGQDPVIDPCSRSSLHLKPVKDLGVIQWFNHV